MDSGEAPAARNHVAPIEFDRGKRKTDERDHAAFARARRDNLKHGAHARAAAVRKRLEEFMGAPASPRADPGARAQRPERALDDEGRRGEQSWRRAQETAPPWLREVVQKKPAAPTPEERSG